MRLGEQGCDDGPDRDRYHEYVPPAHELIVSSVIVLRASGFRLPQKPEARSREPVAELNATKNRRTDPRPGIAGVGNCASPDLRHHLSARRGQNDADGEAAALCRRD